MPDLFDTVSNTPASNDTPLVPARILNEYVYCPRLAYLEWVQKEWAENVDTVKGKYAHRRVDRPTSPVASANAVAEDGVQLHARSVEMEAPGIGLVARLDLMESDGKWVVPVDYKKGEKPDVPGGAYDPERVQLCAQGLILEQNGYPVQHGVLYFVKSKSRVIVEFDEKLRRQTNDTIKQLRLDAQSGRIPPPLENSPKCGRCSLVTICLPDEVNRLINESDKVRPIAVDQTRALPVYVQDNGASVRKRGARLAIQSKDGNERSVRLGEVSQLVAMGNVYVSTPTLHELLRRDIPVVWFSYGGWYLGHSAALGSKNAEIREAQYKGSFDEQVCLKLARGWVGAKITNARTMVLRNWKHGDQRDKLCRQLAKLIESVDACESIVRLLGLEGAAAATYFGCFNNLLVEQNEIDGVFKIEGRNRRPPRDPVNAVLSFCYALLTKQVSVSLITTGFDHLRGFYHQPRYGRPSLALDMMEPFRPILADSVALTVFNNRELTKSDFVSRGEAVNLNAEGRKVVIAAFERRLSQEVKHPLFGYRMSYRRLLEVECRLLSRFLLGEIREYPNFLPK